MIRLRIRRKLQITSDRRKELSLCNSIIYKAVIDGSIECIGNFLSAFHRCRVDWSRQNEDMTTKSKVSLDGTDNVFGYHLVGV